MTSIAASVITDRQARALIVAAEACGFEREPDLYDRHYDSMLHEDAVAAMEHLFVRDPEALLASRSAPDPICPKTAARRIVTDGRVTAADARVLLDAAAQRDFHPSDPELPLGRYGELFEKAEEAVAYFWAEDPVALVDLVGPALRLAPLPGTARRLGYEGDAYR